MGRGGRHDCLSPKPLFPASAPVPVLPVVWVELTLLPPPGPDESKPIHDIPSGSPHPSLLPGGEEPCKTPHGQQEGECDL